jgi:hypothetical protein
VMSGSINIPTTIMGVIMLEDALKTFD